MNTRTIIALITLVVLGSATVAITAEIRTTAEQYLINQERNSAAVERQAARLRNAFAEYDKFKQAAANDRKHGRPVPATATASELTERIDQDAAAAIEAIPSAYAIKQ